MDQTRGRPIVSVIVPCYGVTAFITEALDSLRAQTFRNFETLVINDGCPDTDNLERALLPYRDEIVYLKQANQGVAAARNMAIRAAKAPLIAFLDGDDAWEPNYLAEHVSFLNAHPDVDAVYPNARMFGDNGWAGRLFMDAFPSTGEVTFLSVVKRRCSIYIGLTARRERLEQVGLFDSKVWYQSAEDLDLWLRMLHAGARFAYHKKALVRQRLRRHSLSDGQIRMARAVLRVYGKLLGTLDLTGEKRQSLVEEISGINARINLLCARRALYRGDYPEAIKLFGLANQVIRSPRVAVTIWALRLWPQLLYSYVQRRFQAEESYVR
jgi:glycosyltransferase involved in cell wall biosynthesis